MDQDIAREWRRLTFRWLKIWALVACLYMAHSLWALRASPAIVIIMGSIYLFLIVMVYRLGRAWQRLLNLWDDADDRQVQERRDEQTLKREQARIAEEREANETAETAGDLIALHNELGAEAEWPS